MTRQLHRLVLFCLVGIGCLTICAPNIYGAEEGEKDKISYLCDTAPFTRSLEASDGIVFSLHTSAPLRNSGRILEIARDSYEKIVFELGFNREGYCVANGQEGYVTEYDRVIDIFILSDDVYGQSGILAVSEESPQPPCFEIIEKEDNSVNAVIFLPERVKGMLGAEKDYQDHTLEGMLIHELTHVVLYHYNKNILAWFDRTYHKSGDITSFGKDWYTEGLARYFETLVGSYGYFFSEGYVHEKGSKLVVNREGVNYLAANPTDPFFDARYDYALFWAFVHERYGMEMIEELSAAFRSIRPRDVKNHAPQIMSRVFEEPFDEVMHDFAIAQWSKDFGPRISAGLNDVNCKKLKRRKTIVSDLDPWANDFISIKDSRTLEGSSFNIEAEGSAVISACIVYDDGAREEHEIRLDQEKSAYRFQLSEDRMQDVSEVVLIITNLGVENKIRVTACARDTD